MLKTNYDNGSEIVGRPYSIVTAYCLHRTGLAHVSLLHLWQVHKVIKV